MRKTKLSEILTFSFLSERIENVKNLCDSSDLVSKNWEYVIVEFSIGVMINLIMIHRLQYFPKCVLDT